MATAAVTPDGVGASQVQLPPGPWSTVFEFLCERFPGVGRQEWASRLLRGRVLDASGSLLDAGSAYRVGMTVRYFRELDREPDIPGEVHEVHRDRHLLIVDKPPFLPVAPAGRYLEQTLLVRLRRRYALADLAPLHRIDRATSGLVMFSADPATRGRYQSLFAQRCIDKTYEALAPALPGQDFPVERCSRLLPGEPFFRMREADGTPNSRTLIECLQVWGALAHYRLRPVTGRKHQLRVHMAALGAGILNDPLYPVNLEEAPDDPHHPLMLLARGLAFNDPLSGERRVFESRRRLTLQADSPALHEAATDPNENAATCIDHRNQS